MSDAPSDPTASTDQTTVEQLTTFFDRYYADEIADLAQHYPSERSSLEVSFADLFQFDPEIADRFTASPESVTDQLEEALRRYELPADVDLAGATVRVVDAGESLTTDLDDIRRSEYIGTWRRTHGQVAKVSAVKPTVTEAAWECQRCGTMTFIPVVDDDMQQPHECQGCERQGPFRINLSQSQLTDSQRMKLQRPPDEAGTEATRSVTVRVEKDLAGRVRPGDRVNVDAVVHARQNDTDQPTLSTYLDATGIDFEESDYQDIDVDEHLDRIQTLASGEEGDPYDLLVDSLATSIHGHDTIKLALILQLFGTAEKFLPDGERKRGDSHVLLLGDPGTAKSSLLKAVSEIAPRSVYASGKGASAAGMTAAAVPDDFGDSKWSIEGGAMVTADGGIAAIDEIDKVREEARSSLHEALEAQQVHVNKAGFNLDLNTRTALVAAGNPSEGRFNSDKTIPSQIDLGAALISRFDLMFMLSDKPDEETDREVTQHILDARAAAGRYTADGRSMTDADANEVEPAVDHDVIRAWIAHAKQSVHPIMEDDEVRQKIEDWFVGFRSTSYDEDSPIPITFRSTEAISRLAEASARVRLSEEVTLADAKRAIDLVETSMKQVGFDPDTGEFDVDVIETGESMSQKERRDTIKETLQEMAGEYDDEPGVPVDDLREQLVVEGVRESNVGDALESAKDKGEIYEPKKDFYLKT